MGDGRRGEHAPHTGVGHPHLLGRSRSRGGESRYRARLTDENAEPQTPKALPRAKRPGSGGAGCPHTRDPAWGWHRAG